MTALEDIVEKINKKQHDFKFGSKLNEGESWLNKRALWKPAGYLSNSDLASAKYQIHVTFWSYDEDQFPFDAALKVVMSVLENAGFTISVNNVRQRQEMGLIEEDGKIIEMVSPSEIELSISGSFQALTELDIGRLMIQQGALQPVITDDLNYDAKDLLDRGFNKRW